MIPRMVTMAAAMVLTSFAAACFWDVPAAAQAAPTTHDIPQSIRLAHNETLAQLESIAKRKTETGPIAQKALEVFKAHIRREEEYILPPLTLAPAIAEGRVTPDMKWAIAMTDRIKADREAIFAEHTVITERMIELTDAAERTGEKDVIAFAQEAVTDSLNDTEVTEPAAIVIGEYLRAKLPAGP
jgi:hypothetical protein